MGAPRFRAVGVTDDVTTCECCGKQNLKRTVMLVALDADGNAHGEPTHYGVNCAGRALSIRGGKARVEGAISSLVADEQERQRRARIADLDASGAIVLWRNRCYFPAGIGGKVTRGEMTIEQGRAILYATYPGLFN